MLFCNVSFSADYHGPSSAGVEKLECGEYKIKGLLTRGNRNEIDQKDRYYLEVYPGTTRRYVIQVVNQNYQQLFKNHKSLYVNLTGFIFKKGLASESMLFVRDREMSITTHVDSLKSSILKKRDVQCLPHKLAKWELKN